MLSLLVPSSALGAEVVPTASLDSTLARWVHGGRVDYRALAADSGPLRRYLAAAAGAAPERFGRAEQMAFWINTYNARALDGVIRRPGLKSVLDSTAGLPGLFREQRRSGGRDLSLDEIERTILRHGFREPRIHFVLNCASASCPPLPGRALIASTLDSTLNAAARRFLGDRSKNRWGQDRRLELSSIFDWYREDFVAAAGSIAAYVARYWSQGARPTTAAEIRFLPYDWSLNGTW